VLTISKELGQGGIKPWQCAQTPLHAQGLSFDKLMNGGGQILYLKKAWPLKEFDPPITLLKALEP